MQIFFTIGAFLVAIGLLVLVHEMGHFLVAKGMGVKVLKFSLGFGPALLSRRFGKDRTEYVIAALPLGGYVKMLGEDGGEPIPPEERRRAFDQQAPWRRFLIALAGPVFNLAFAVLAFGGVYMVGVPSIVPIVGAVNPGSVAARAGLEPGMRVVAFNGESVLSWHRLRMDLLGAAVARTPARMELRQDGTLREVVLHFNRLPADVVGPDFVEKYVGISPDMPIRVGLVQPASAAAQAGLQVGDRVLAVDGAAPAGWGGFLKVVEGHPGKPLQFLIERDGARRLLTVTPGAVAGPHGKIIGRIGIGLAPLPPELVVIDRQGPLEAVISGAKETWRMTVLTVDALIGMVEGFISPDTISGPVAIAEYAGQSAQAGLGPFLAFLGLISVSLGILNLLPIPVLDGGHLVFYAIEMVRGRPLSATVMQRAQQVGIVLLLMLMTFAFYNDITRLVQR